MFGLPRTAAALCPRVTTSRVGRKTAPRIKHDGQETPRGHSSHVDQSRNRLCSSVLLIHSLFLRLCCPPFLCNATFAACVPSLSPCPFVARPSVLPMLSPCSARECVLILSCRTSHTFWSLRCHCHVETACRIFCCIRKLGSF